MKDSSMGSRFRIRVIDAMVVVTLICGGGYMAAHRPAKVAPPEFASKVDLQPFDRIAVHAEGRLRSFESHAKTFVKYFAGPRQIDGQSNGFTYLDLLMRPEAYKDRDIIYIKNKQVRDQIVKLLEGHQVVTAERAAKIWKSGLIAPNLLQQPEVQDLLRKLGADLIRTGKQVDEIEGAMGVARSEVLGQELRVAPPPSGDANAQWLSITDIAALADASPASIPGLDPEIQKSLTEGWKALQSAWRAQNATEVNQQIATLASLFPKAQPGLYPEAQRLSMESWYFRYGSMTWVWLIYLACVIPLLLSVIYGWRGARLLGMGLFLVAFAFHTASIGVRFYISGRWPNANMFEAVTTAAWFGGILALILEVLVRKTAFRSLFALGSAIVSMAALMAARFLPTHLDSSIGNIMPALHDVWLYIHTNVIIWSYAIIGLAAVTALLQLRHRWCAAWDAGEVAKFRLIVLPIAMAILNATGWWLLMAYLDPEGYPLAGSKLYLAGGLFGLSGFVLLLEALDARQRGKDGGVRERAVLGGAAALISGRKSKADGFLRQASPATSQVLDGATMVAMEVSFIMLWTGIVMGAIWADHSWGRPWGWDPKEVFALNTFIIFLVLVHIRYKVADKGLWTAVLAVVGLEVMLFNWIVINFVISGLHSYA